MKKANTRQHLLEVGKQLIWEKGYTATGIQDVLHAAGVPKGSFYHYFASKDAFVLAALESYMQEYDTYVGHYLEDETHTPLERLQLFFEAAGRWYASLLSYRGCMVGNLSQELAAYNEPFRARLQDALTHLRLRIQRCIAQAQASGELSPTLEVEQTADFCLNSLHGALLRMKVEQDPAPLHTFLRILFERVLTR
ncbi:TetR family transcriptional regulator [Ktedonosporobacter rubrisoli]|uniref:TetR family transcriptional regulator n=1 Tax=Ktedonosporobacter rubrisoli TaxID=2509675 RepID=A0A4P6JNT5_KTERU|nr:TetR/AcrR family transcriptional regulator [Ktedonosporobacter rubrisoli]QBD76954.1 TetR family transcriptional regulator [Ktedonosporobacter rubrisoli]